MVVVVLYVREMKYMTPVCLVCSYFTAFFQANIASVCQRRSYNERPTAEEKRNHPNRQGVRQMTRSARASIASMYLLPVVGSGLGNEKEAATSCFFSKVGFLCSCIFFQLGSNSVSCTKKIKCVQLVPPSCMNSFRLAFFHTLRVFS